MKTTRLAALATLMLVIASCGGGDAAEGVDITGAWARSSPAMAGSGAAYMEITSTDDDALVGVSVDPSVAATAEVHETVMADHSEDSMTDDSMSDDSIAGMGEMTMQEVASIDLPAGETVALEPGGYHVMLLDLVAPLETGDTFDVTLSFENTGDQVVTVEVRDEAP